MSTIRSCPWLCSFFHLHLFELCEPFWFDLNAHACQGWRVLRQLSLLLVLFSCLFACGVHVMSCFLTESCALLLFRCWTLPARDRVRLQTILSWLVVPTNTSSIHDWWFQRRFVCGTCHLFKVSVLRIYRWVLMH